MKLDKILDQLNSLEKNAFLKIIDSIISENPKITEQIDKILNIDSKDLKSVDNLNIAKIFGVVEKDFKRLIHEEFVHTTSQLDILTDILVRDGNCIMKQDWFGRLYEKEIKSLEIKLKAFQARISSEDSDIDLVRQRDYRVYRECLKVAFENDDFASEDRKITSDEQTILYTLSKQLELSQEEIKLINYSIIPICKIQIEKLINNLRSIGVIFYSKKSNTVFVAQEMVKILREIRGKDVADKYYKRILKQLREPQINMVCKKHNIDWRQPIESKIEDIISKGISLHSLLGSEIHKEGTFLNDKKKFINEFNEKGFNIPNPTKGVSLEEKIQHLIDYFNEIEGDEKVSISMDGYENLLVDLKKNVPKINQIVRDAFEFQEEDVLSTSFLLERNIKPRDIIELMSEEMMKAYCEVKGIKVRGDLITNLLDSYMDTENLYLENYENIASRKLLELKENGIQISDAEIGVKFEELTKLIFEKLGFNVDEQLRKKINTKYDKADIVINLGNDEVILVECKSVKESGFNKFSSVKRQLKSYFEIAEKNGLKVVKSLLVAPSFSDDFINECELEYELNLSLLQASSLYTILEGFKNSKKGLFPYKLLMRDVLIKEDRILKSLS
jgi:flavodoxin